MSVTEADAGDYLSFFCREEIETAIQHAAKWPPGRGRRIEYVINDLLPNFRNAINQLEESLDAGLNMCLVSAGPEFDEKYVYVDAIRRIFSSKFSLEFTPHAPPLYKIQWSLSDEGVRSRIDIRAEVKPRRQEIDEQSRRRMEQFEEQAKEREEKRLALENEAAAYQKAMEEYRKKKAEASQKAPLPIQTPVAASASAEKVQPPIVVSEEQVGTLLDAVAEIRRDLDGLLKTQALLASEGADVSFVQKDIDELKRKRAITIAALDEAVNPTPGKRRRM